MKNKIQVDVWAGYLHQKLAVRQNFDSWAEASAFIEQQVEAGMLCNVLHTDFKSPGERKVELDKVMLNLCKEGFSDDDK